MAEGFDGIVYDRTRPPGKAPVPPEREAGIVRLTQGTAAARTYGDPLDAAR